MAGKAKKVVVGGLLAGTAGYLAGILTAPKKGEETRREIIDEVAKQKMQAERKLKSLHKELTELIESSKDKAHVVATKAHGQLKDATANAKQARQKAKLMISAIRSGEAEDPDLASVMQEAKTAKSHLKSFLKK